MKRRSRSTEGYAELHCHSNFSFLEGASHPRDLVERAAELGYDSLAITDRNGLYGVVRFSEACRERGIRPLFGAEVVLENGSSIVLLVKNKHGYANLGRLLTRAQMSGNKGEAKLSREMLEEYSEGLIALSGSIFDSLFLAGNTKEARQYAAYYSELFGSRNFFLELVHHNLPVHEYMCGKLYDLGKELGIPAVATNNVYYATADRRPLQDVLTCIRNRTNLDKAAGLLYPNGERYLKSYAQMKRRFELYPEAVTASVRIAERCDFSINELSTSLPDFSLPPDETSYSYLRRLTYEGAAERYGDLSEVVHKQIEHELSIIHRLNFSGYFLIVWDIVRFCRGRKILCQGRGSAANSAVCYCLAITAVDPIKLDLLFERFISEERSDPPDIDIDIAHTRREEVIQYVYEKYGREHAAMVCEIISYRGKSSVRDVGKALGFSQDEVNKMSRIMNYYSRGEDVPEKLQDARLNRSDRRVQLLTELCEQIQGFPRHLGIHVGGMIITRRPLSELVPIENATMPDRSVIQWDKDDAGDIGMAKIDLLGLGMLTLIDIALKLVKENLGVTIDPAKLSYDDPKVYELMCRADTVGVFQVESRAQMNTLPRQKPRKFYDLVVEVALIRPGPIQGDMVHPYLRRRNGEEPVTYPHPSLEPILKRTLGVPLFQEQGMRVAITAASFTASQADELRRSMGHKRSREKIDALSTALVEGMLKNGYSKEAAEKIFLQLASFADFGFAESHAASFALLVYVSAYLKLYYPLEFYCSLLNAQPMGFYTPSTIIYEAQRKGIKILPVNVLRSIWDCTTEGDAVRLGFRYVKKLGPAAEEILENELMKSPFVSLEDFVFRTDLDKDSLEQLAMVGAFDCFGLKRREALWEILAIRKQDEQELNLTELNNGRGLLEDMGEFETVAADFRGLDLSTGPHPMSLVRERLKAKGICSSVDLREFPDKKSVLVAGVVVIRQRPGTAKGFMFITLEDETGFANIVVRPNLAKQFRADLIGSSALLVRGTLEKKDGVINVMGERFYPLQLTDKTISFKSRDFR